MSVFGRFFHGSGSDLDFWLIRIQTQEKSLIRIPENKPGSKTLDFSSVFSRRLTLLSRTWTESVRSGWLSSVHPGSASSSAR